MKLNGPLWLPAIFFAAVMLTNNACRNPNETGSGILPDEDLVFANYADTISVSVNTLVEDSVRTSDLSHVMVGDYTDPEFGRISAGVFLQFTFSGSDVVFEDNPGEAQLDSLVLSLDISGYYGKYNEPIELEIFEITDADFVSGTDFYSTDQLNFDDSKEYSNGYVIDFSNDEGIYDLRIPLDASLGEKFLHADESNLASGADFTNFFNGLYIRARPTSNFSREPGAVFYIDLEQSKTAITMYYQKDTFEVFEFIIDDESPHFHHVSRSDYDSRLLGVTLASTGAPEYNFIESGALIRMSVQFPYLTEFVTPGINRAVLELQVDPTFYGSQNRFTPPGTIYAFLADSTGTEVFSAEAQISSANFDISDNVYRIPLTNNVLQTISGRLENNGLILVPSYMDATLNRAVIGGTGHPTLRPKLKVVYTDVPD